MSTFTLCADFSLFPDNYPLGPVFSLAGFDFAQLGAGAPIIVNVTGNERGLQVPEDGLEITLPTALPKVDLRIGAFAGDINLEAFDGTGTSVLNRLIPGTNSYVDEVIEAPGITKLKLTGGGNEGLIPRICVKITVC